jgi:predicted branched-subunit amino acid permease
MADRSFNSGMTANLPIAASVAAYGSVLGVLAAQKGIGWGMLLVMNLTVFAGSAQFVMVDLWLPQLPVLEIVFAVTVINLRYLFIGASLQPLFKNTSLGHKASRMHLVADENWAITMAAWRQGHGSTSHLLGGGICVLVAWCLGTLTGHAAGAAIAHPEKWALDFAFVAVFSALAVTLWRDRQDLVPWIVAALLSILASQWIHGKWYIVIGGVGGALAAALASAPQPSRRHREKKA